MTEGQAKPHPRTVSANAAYAAEYERLKTIGELRVDEIKKVDSGKNTHQWAVRNALRRIARANGQARPRTERLPSAADQAKTNFIRAIGILHTAADALSNMTDALPDLEEHECKMVRQRLGEVVKVIFELLTREGVQ